MATKAVSLDTSELRKALEARTIFFVGAAVCVLTFAVVFGSAALLGPTFKEYAGEIQLLNYGLNGLGSLVVGAAALKARRPLGLPAAGVVVGCLISAIIPCFFWVLVLSLLIRFANYFSVWRTYLDQSSWSPKAFLASEAGQNWQTVSIMPGQRAADDRSDYPRTNL